MQIMRNKKPAANHAVGHGKPGGLEFAFWAFLMIAVGRLGELIPGMTAIPAAKITLAFTLVFLIGKWKDLPVFADVAKPLSRNAIWLGVLAVLLTPISYWRGASVAFLYQELLILIAVTVISYQMSRSWITLRGTLFILVLAGLALTRAALSGYSGGRAAADTMYDTNDLAYFLITVFPIAIGFALVATGKVRKLIYAGIAGAFAIAILLTSSRGGFLGLVAVGILIIFLPIKHIPVATGAKQKPKKRNLFVPLLLSFCACAIVWPQLPADTRERLASVVNLGDDYNLDADNKKSRGSIWKRNLPAVFERPIGYGPRSFGMVDLNHGGMMMAPHNSFVQTAVELGFVGLVLFLRMYVLAWRLLGRSRTALLKLGDPTPERREQIVFARMLQLGLVGNAIAGFFLTMAYSTVLWVMFGVTMGFIAIASRPDLTKSGS